MNTFLYYFFIFIIYTFLGWVLEVAFIFIKTKRFVNRGFLIGPACPIYGFGALIMMFYLTQYKDEPFTVFIMGAFICSTLEYITSYIMEKIFKARWWDYSDKKFNVNGRICLTYAFLFGLCGVIMICFTNPIIIYLLNLIPENIMVIISSSFLIIFITDVLVSFNIISKFKTTALNIAKDSTEEINKKVIETIKNKVLQKRIVKAFPSLKFQFNLRGRINRHMSKK